MTYLADREHSTRDLEAVVWPLLRQLTGAELESVEIQHGGLADDLDRMAGIDAYARVGQRLISIASRIQWRRTQRGDSPWARGKSPMTFTIRRDTELIKRREALADGGMCPDWTLQAYLEQPGGPVENFALARTADLYGVVGERETANVPYPTKSAPDGTMFLIVPWTDVQGWRWFRANRPTYQTGLFR